MKKILIVLFFLLFCVQRSFADKIYLVRANEEGLPNSIYFEKAKFALDHFTVKGYEVIISTQSTIKEFIQAFSDPETIAVIHVGHSNDAIDGSPNLGFYYKGTPAVFTEETYNFYKNQVPGGYKVSPKLKFFLTFGCYSAFTENIYKKIFEIPDNVVFKGWDLPVYYSENVFGDNTVSNGWTIIDTFADGIPNIKDKLDLKEYEYSDLVEVSFESSGITEKMSIMMTLDDSWFGGILKNIKFSYNEQAKIFENHFEESWKAQKMYLPFSKFIKPRKLGFININKTKKAFSIKNLVVKRLDYNKVIYENKKELNLIDILYELPGLKEDKKELNDLRIKSLENRLKFIKDKKTILERELTRVNLIEKKIIHEMTLSQ